MQPHRERIEWRGKASLAPGEILTHGRSAGEVAIAWTRRHPAITATIVGARRPDQIDELAGAGEFELNDAEAEELEHRDTARAAGSAQAVGYPLLTAAIRAGCRMAITLSKHI